MSLNTIIRAAITPIVPECVPDRYTGAATEYCVFEYGESPAFSADGVPLTIQYDITLHWYLPAGISPIAKKARIKAALVAAGCSYPTVIPVGDTDGQHYAFDCIYTEVT